MSVGRQSMVDKVYLQLKDSLGIRENEQEAAKLLVASCIQCEERTRPTLTQKKGYKGVQFNFNDPLDMAVHFINELPQEWEAWKEQTEIWKQTDGNEKKLLRPTIDRIDPEVAKHYQRGNIRMMSHINNALEAVAKPQRAMLIYPNGESKLFEFTTIKELKEKLGEHFSEEVLNKLKSDTGSMQHLEDGYSIVIQGLKTEIDAIGISGKTKKKLLKFWTVDAKLDDHEPTIIITEHQIPLEVGRIIIGVKQDFPELVS